MIRRTLATAAFGLVLVASWAAAGPDRGLGKVEVLRDSWGVPHVFAETDAGAMYGLGVASVEDRAFQMHYALRIIQGRLAEVVGERADARGKETAPDHDRRMRTFGFYRAAQAAAQRLDPQTRGLFQAYADGVNDGIAANRERLHPLFAKLGLSAEPWTPADCIASWWHLGQFFGTDGTRELMQYRNLARPAAPRPGPGGRQGLVPPTPTAAWFDDEAAVVRRADVGDEWMDQLRQFMRREGLQPVTRPATGPAGPKFSHAWVVGGKRTTTGAAVLVSDPQTPVRNPSLWYEFHISGKTFNARGIGVAGCPGLLIGWNEHVAWGATALGADQADLFRLKTDADHPDQYFYDGQWRPMQVIRETIRVKGGPDVPWEVRQTHFGPVVTKFAFPAAGDPEVAVRRVPVSDPDTGTFAAMPAMLRATDAAGLARAAATWQFPSVHFVYGDRQGNIGYGLLAAFQLRSPRDEHAGAAAIDGTRADLDWRGFVPREMLPHLINPARGWIASANHSPVGSFYPLPLGLSTGASGHTIRSWRLYERLSARERFEPADVLDVHFDAVNPARRDIVKLGLHLRNGLRGELSPDATRALTELEGWLGRGAKSDLTERGAALAGEISTFFRLMNTPLAARFGGGESGICRYLRDADRRLDRDARAPLDPEERSFIDAALAGAWASAMKRYGPDPAAWDAGARTQVAQQTLGSFDTLDGFGSLDPDGDLRVPALTDVDGGTIRSQAAQSYTQYVPLHDPDAAMSLLPPGQSERPADASRTGTMRLWEQGRLHPAPLSRAAVERITVSRRGLSE